MLIENSTKISKFFSKTFLNHVHTYDHIIIVSQSQSQVHVRSHSHKISDSRRHRHGIKFRIYLLACRNYFEERHKVTKPGCYRASGLLHSVFNVSRTGHHAFSSEDEPYWLVSFRSNELKTEAAGCCVCKANHIPGAASRAMSRCKIKKSRLITKTSQHKNVQKFLCKILQSSV